MRKLHLVGLTTDRDGLIFTARKGSKSGGFIVPLDEKVLAAVAEARGTANGAPSEPEAVPGEVAPVARRLRSQSALTPREMQARLRAGRSIEEVAAEAGVDSEWVARFAVPILAEQAQVVELARGLVYAKPRLGESSERLGASVVQNLSDRGVFLPDDVANAGWSAFQLHDSVWMVRFRYRSRGRQQEAQWEIDVPSGRLHARNRHASDLGYVEPGRRSRVVVPEEQAAEDGAAAAPAPPPRRAKRRTAKVVPTATAAATSKQQARARTRAPVAKRSRRKPAVPVGPTKSSKPAKAAKAAKVRKVGTAGKARTGAKVGKVGKVTKPATKPATKAVPATAKRRSKAAPATSAARGRPTKGGPPPEAGPAAGSGSVRMAVAQVSTARVAASLASADREPWAAVVRPRQGARRAGASGSADASSARRQQDRDTAEAVPAFQPRPLPAGGDPSPSPSPPARVRKVTVPRPTAAKAAPDPVSLPAPRRPQPRPEPLPTERTKRRRLRSR